MDDVDVMQFHGGMFEPDDMRHILEDPAPELRARVEAFEPPADMADMPRLTAGIYRAEDEEARVTAGPGTA